MRLPPVLCATFFWAESYIYIPGWIFFDLAWKSRSMTAAHQKIHHDHYRFITPRDVTSLWASLRYLRICVVNPLGSRGNCVADGTSLLFGRCGGRTTMEKVHGPFACSKQHTVTAVPSEPSVAIDMDSALPIASAQSPETPDPPETESTNNTSSVVRASTAKVGGLRFDSQWLPKPTSSSEPRYHQREHRPLDRL